VGPRNDQERSSASTSRFCPLETLTRHRQLLCKALHNRRPYLSPAHRSATDCSASAHRIWITRSTSAPAPPRRIKLLVHCTLRQESRENSASILWLAAPDLARLAIWCLPPSSSAGSVSRIAGSRPIRSPAEASRQSTSLAQQTQQQVFRFQCVLCESRSASSSSAAYAPTPAASLMREWQYRPNSTPSPNRRMPRNLLGSDSTDACDPQKAVSRSVPCPSAHQSKPKCSVS